MKRGTPRHPKLQHLCELLKCSRPEAVGFLELLWHFAAEFAPQGDIGRFDDDRIEAALYWNHTRWRKRGDLIRALTTSGWVDIDTPSGLHQEVINTASGGDHHPINTASDLYHRLIIHDWGEHADESVRKRIARAGLSFVKHTPKVTGQCPDMSGIQGGQNLPALPLPPPEPLPEPLPLPQVSPAEWPQTAAAVKAVDAAANGIFVNRLVQATIQAAISDGNVNVNLVNDQAIAQAIAYSIQTGPKRHGAGLLLSRVPEIIVTWGHDG